MPELRKHKDYIDSVWNAYYLNSITEQQRDELLKPL